MKLAIELFEEGHEIEQITSSICHLYHRTEVDLIKFVVKNGIGMYKSLAIAVDSAGDSGWPVDKLLKMTIMDLFSRLAINRVRFVYDENEK